MFSLSVPLVPPGQTGTTPYRVVPLSRSRGEKGMLTEIPLAMFEKE